MDREAQSGQAEARRGQQEIAGSSTTPAGTSHEGRKDKRPLAESCGDEPSLADAVELARAKSKLRTSKVQEPERVGLPQLDFGSADDYLEGVALEEARRERDQSEVAPEEAAGAAAAASGAGAEQPQAQPQSYCFWQEAQDPTSGCLYYYHSALQKTQWEPPASEGYLNLQGAYQAPASAAAFAEAVQPAEQRTGWCYTDSFGFRQGPFTKEQLRVWAGAAQLSGDTEVWLQTIGDAAGKGPAEAPRSRISQLFPEDSATGPPQDPSSDTSAQQSAGKAAGTAIGPETTSSTYGDWAAAALAGLPSDDEAVKLANLAAAAGHTIEDMLQFNYASASDKGAATSTGAPVAKAVYNPRTGRIEQPQAEEEVSVYAGMESWVDTRTLEGSLQAMQERKGKQLPPAVWKQLKARKQQVKQKVRKMESSWMYN